ATSTIDSTKSASATITLNAPVPTISITPGSVSLAPGQSKQFTATFSDNSNTTVIWSLDALRGNPPPRTVTQAGLYTAPASVSNPVTITIRATSSANPWVTGTAQMRLTKH